jgi:hypothetical protein
MSNDMKLLQKNINLFEVKRVFTNYNNVCIYYNWKSDQIYLGVFYTNHTSTFFVLSDKLVKINGYEWLNDYEFIGTL